jgi:UDP-N-acetylglucosamine--N-acetylmuramyl-(pentapeptide) pyrophosphoryl-undecaprenol N-acetylglucosamine transferase
MTSERPARVVFAGGGTGGHLYPAIAIADRLRDLLAPQGGADILFVGTRHGLEYRQRESLGYPLHLINMRGLARSFSLRNLLVPLIALTALVQASRLLRKFRPDLVVGTGGYVAWPVLNRATAQGVPTVLQEQNSFPGIVTRRTCRAARRIYLGFEGAREHLPSGVDILVTGNPVRGAIGSADRSEAIREFGLDPNKKTILILGGSQGARAINQAILQSLARNSLDAGYQLLWQTGKREYKDVSATAGDKVTGRSLFPFAERMDLVYAAADMAIARAGALTLAELIACDLPAILIPYPFAAGDHQRHNASEMVARGMALMIDEKELSGKDLLKEATTLMASGSLERMRQSLAVHNRDRKPAVEIIAEDIVKIISEGKAGA